MHGCGSGQGRGLRRRCQRHGGGCQPISRGHTRGGGLVGTGAPDARGRRVPGRAGRRRCHRRPQASEGDLVERPMLGLDRKSEQARAVRLRAQDLIDIENAVIVDVEATPARTYDEVAAARMMIERTEQRVGLKPRRLAADTAYGTGKFLGWLAGAGITPQIPVWDKSAREDGTFSRSDFTFDRERNVYVCPAGKLLKTTGSIGDDHVLRYLASKRDCDTCPLKPQCCPNMLSRKVTRDINEDARDLARALMGTPEFDRSRDERKKVEMRFAHLKTHHRFERMRLRGLSGARDEFHLAAIVQNLKTLAIRNRPPPPNRPAMCAA